MLIFWSLVRNSVVLAVYLLFSVACFFTVHEHCRRASLGDVMKLNPNFVIHNIDRETLLVPTAEAPFHGLVQGNPTVVFILNHLRQDTT